MTYNSKVMSATPGTGPEKPPFDWKGEFARASARVARASSSSRSFWQRVTDGFELAELWKQFRAEARASYGFYSQEVDWKAVEKEKGFRRVFKIAQSFFWAMLVKLSPARRVVLLVALLCVLFSRFELRGGDASTTIELHWVGALLLFLLLALELADRVTMKRDLEIAREIQHWLVPEKPPAVPGADIAFATRPANTVAGDYYDAFYRGPGAGRLLLVVADVAGKSVPAALLMATFQASLQTLSITSGSLEELILGINRYACAHSLGGLRFTTAFLAEYDPASRELEYVCAGHNPPVLRRVTGTFERLDRGGLPFGIEAETTYESGRVTLGRGDVLLIFTDGLVEAFNEKHEEYGEHRLIEMMNTVPGESAPETLRHLMQAVDGFVGAVRQHDDITCLVLRAV